MKLALSFNQRFTQCLLQNNTLMLQQLMYLKLLCAQHKNWSVSLHMLVPIWSSTLLTNWMKPNDLLKKGAFCCCHLLFLCSWKVSHGISSSRLNNEAYMFVELLSPLFFKRVSPSLASPSKLAQVENWLILWASCLENFNMFFHELWLLLVHISLAMVILYAIVHLTTFSTLASIVLTMLANITLRKIQV